ncbi:OB-fold nucleic acid binding domain-containing protein [Nocardioides terrisoli]|uniref:OB-fold nucleic acid binding domain-containing protein n=1 Tax=Nocardioides terrisoli TaxID=3388267 RepID=UPI00287B5F71|nr:OB-fold nucleic acid binding domain-containing protein [Nocardioides marmorisolisilvae]
MAEKSRLRQSISRWASPGHEEARELRRDAEKSGLVTLKDAPNRELVTVQGTLRTVTLRPRGGVPALEAELYDGTDTITVLWLGRRRIAGVFPGRAVQVTGRIGEHDSARIMYNPRYDLKY